MAVFPATSLDEAIDLIIEDGNKFGEVLRGDINTDITVDGGIIPSISKAINVMAAYRTPVPWVETNSETDLLQPRTFTDGVYVPTQVPALMDATPNPALWKLYLPNNSVAASNVINAPAGNVAATDAQAAINELDTEKVAKAGDTMTGNLTLDEVTETVHVMATVAVDASNGTWQTRTLAGNETLTFSLATGQAVYVTVVPGANTLTLTNVNEWVGGAAPSSIEAEHAFVFWSDNGSTITGNSLGGIS